MRLDGATVLVTGSNRGIGLAIAKRLAAEPVRLLAGVRDLDRWPGLDAAGARASEVRPVRIDLSSRESIEDSLAALGEEVERIDVLVNNAGAFAAGLLEEHDLDDVYGVVQVNLTGAIHLTRRVLPGMLRRGRGLIVNQASIEGYARFPAATVYSATKAGLSAFTAALRRELEGTGVSTLELVTGGVDTDMLGAATERFERHMDTSKWQRLDPDEWADRIVEAIAAGRSRLRPGGRAELAMAAAAAPEPVLDALVRRAFSRTPRS